MVLSRCSRSDSRDQSAMANQYTRRLLDVIPTGAAFQAEGGISRATESEGLRSSAG